MSNVPGQAPAAHLGHHGAAGATMDPEMEGLRDAMRRSMLECLKRKSMGSDWQQKLPQLARRLEEVIYKESIDKNDYSSKFKVPGEHLLQAAIKTLQQHTHQMPQQQGASSGASYGTMIPTPGLAQNTGSIQQSNPQMAHQGASTSRLSSGIDNMIRPTGVAGLMSNGYQHATGNNVLHSGSGIQQSMTSVSASGNRQITQMIPTPGFNNQHNLPTNSDYSSGAFSTEASVLQQTQQQQQQHQQHQQQQQQQPQQYTGNQSGYGSLQHLGGQIGSTVASSAHQRPSQYGLSNGLMNGGMGTSAPNMQALNGPSTADGYMNMGYGNNLNKTSQQLYNQQQHLQHRMPVSYPSQMMAGMGDASVLKGVGAVTAANNMNAMSMQSKLMANPAILAHQSTVQAIQPQQHIQNLILDQQDKSNFQSAQLPQAQILTRHQMLLQNKQQQNQSHAQIDQNSQSQMLQQPGMQNKHLLLRSNSFRPSSTGLVGNEQVVGDPGIISGGDMIMSQGSDQSHLTDFHGRYQQKISHDSSKGVQMYGNVAEANFQTVARDSLGPLPHQRPEEALSENNSLFGGPQTETLLNAQWKAQQTEKANITECSLPESRNQEDFRHKMMGQNETQPHLSSDMQLVAIKSNSTGLTGTKRLRNEFEQRAIAANRHNQLRLLMGFYHGKRCQVSPGKCPSSYCQKLRELAQHIESCNKKECLYRYCADIKKIVKHCRSCEDNECPICSKAKKLFIDHPPEQMGAPDQKATQENLNGLRIEELEVDLVPVGITDDQQPTPAKKPKIQPMSPPIVSQKEIPPTFVPLPKMATNLEEVHSEVAERKKNVLVPKQDLEIDVDTQSLPDKRVYYGADASTSVMRQGTISGVRNDVKSTANQDILTIDEKLNKKTMEINHEKKDPAIVSTSKSGKPKIKGVSLTELFTLEQIKDHIRSLRQWVGQSKAKAERNQAKENSMSENSCQLCAVEKLTFEPPPLYCSSCGVRIKRNAAYYTGGAGESRHYFCVPCFNEARGDTIEVEGVQFSKAKLEKKKNDEETEEGWVQCDKCEAWQHQICALFNRRRDEGEQAEYTCPNCYIDEIKGGEREPLPQNSVLGAKDLPRTILSDHIEQRLFTRLKHERQERAKFLGKSFDEVPGADGLVVRVVSSVDKNLEVKPRFLEIFQEENYPTDFPYKSKAILLFQRIEGVEVCLFGMYVQEFGSECPQPNQRRVYLSYLDSVKYFRPEIRTVSGEALRTFVYHEILIGYLEYCKKRGFTSCYIWACPPLKGEDYILYCHPEIQKTPKSDKLREWYLSMLRKATKESIVVELTNMYDHFFINLAESKAKVTAARLPYFDGDYWPGAAEDIISQLCQVEDDRKQQKKGKSKKTVTKRAWKIAGHNDLTANASKDALLMQKLGDTIYPMKQDFIMVHLQYSCSHCCILMVSGTRWVCKECRNFHICDKCHDAELTLDDRDRHPTNSRDVHILHPVEITDVPEDTKDRDDILESEFFDTRQAFLSLCQGNHYQYDTLRRAKHSSMMVLYHLHNPTAPAFVSSCNICLHDIETGQGWRCETCPEYDVCIDCYQSGVVKHPHKLSRFPSANDLDAQNKEARQQRVVQLRRMLDLLVHASQCRVTNCTYPNCVKVKMLFRHGINCKVRASSGCIVCKRMWYLLHIHARACKSSDCSVPRCRDLREHFRRSQVQSETRRRAAVNEMMRQRAAEFNNE